MSRRTASNDDDLYGVLGIVKTASDAEIKRAYKKLALLHHPDKNPEAPAEAEIKFKRVTRAYEVLSKPEMRARYDRYGVSGLEGGEGGSSPSHNHHYHTASSGRHAGGGTHPFSGMGGGVGGFPSGFAFHDPFEVFRSVFGGNDPFADMMDRHHSAAANRDPKYGSHGHPADPFRSQRATDRTGGMNDRRQQQRPSSLFDQMMGGGFMGGSMFADDFFGGGMMRDLSAMNLHDGMMDRSSATASGMQQQRGARPGGVCVSTSQSVSTVIRNGQRVTRTVVRKTDENGVTTEDVDEEVEDMGKGNPHRTHHSSIRGGGGDQHRAIQFMF